MYILNCMGSVCFGIANVCVGQLLSLTVLQMMAVDACCVCFQASLTRLGIFPIWSIFVLRGDACKSWLWHRCTDIKDIVCLSLPLRWLHFGITTWLLVFFSPEPLHDDTWDRNFEDTSAIMVSYAF